MKNILMITPIYPGNGTPKGYTPVVHYFTKEWIRMGYNVRVIHTSAYYPQLFYMAPKFIRDIVENREGITLPAEKINNEGVYVHDDVKIYRIAVRKNKPHGGYSNRILKELCLKSEKFLKDESFRPDVIISHWTNPTAYLMHHLKQIYSCTSVLVLHGCDNLRDIYPNAKDLHDSVDIWGYRSEKIQTSFEKNNGKPKYSFRCYSGIPESWLSDPAAKNWNRINNYVYVGQLIERKYPDTVIDAVSEYSANEDFNLTLIGDGAMREKLDRQTHFLGAKDKVSFTGRIPREEVLTYLDKSEVFIMISRNEVFGLVYLEAMARGCITIASKDEGMEGIIEDGVNGFLCNAGDKEELKQILEKIHEMTPEQLFAMSEKARKTASILTDKNVAEDYIDTILEFKDKIERKIEMEPLYHSMLARTAVGGNPAEFIKKRIIKG